MSDDPPTTTQGEKAARGGGPFGRFFSVRSEGSPYPKAELLLRLLARLTDFILAAFLAIAAGEAGKILAVLFLLFGDGMLHGQSPGKKLLGIKVVHLPSRRDADYRESALRNFPFAFALLLQTIPSAGEFLFWTLGPAVLVYEGWRVVSDKLGLRAGDVFAQTQVVDTKVVAGALSRPELKIVPPSPDRVRGAVRVLLDPPQGPS
ncbi:MAG: RDD family protein [Deltaproteobacteria bacterium]|nr:RDD family protein [Deltaproteobacteria bacterium]